MTLKYGDSSWHVEVEKRGETCYFGKGWKDFYNAVGLKEGDYIVGFNEKPGQKTPLKLCIYRKEEHSYNFEEGTAIRTKHKILYILCYYINSWSVVDNMSCIFQLCKERNLGASLFSRSFMLRHRHLDTWYKVVYILHDYVIQL